MRKRDQSPETLDALWKMFGWSLNALLTGITPEMNWEDRPCDGANEFIAEGWRGARIQVRGDWEFYANVLRFPNWATNVNMCWMCQASNIISHLKWQNAGADAGWRSTRRPIRSKI